MRYKAEVMCVNQVREGYEVSKGVGPLFWGP